MNKVILCGNLTTNIEMSTTTGGTKVGNFTLAVNRQFNNASGEKETDFIRIVVWDKLAENCNKFISKGSKVIVIGELQIRNYEKDNVKKYITEINAREVEFVSTKNKATQENKVSDESVKGNEVSDEPAQANKLTPVDDDQLPF